MERIFTDSSWSCLSVKLMDYRSIEAEVAHIKGMGESPAMFKKELVSISCLPQT